MIKEFFNKLFCSHHYEQVGFWELPDRMSIKYVCRKCGKEYWDTIRY